MNYQPEQLLEIAKKYGIEEAEVYQVNSQSQPVFFEGNRLKQIETTTTQGTALRLWKEGKPGLAVGYGEVEGEILVEKAIALSELNPPEIPELLSDKREIYPVTGDEIEVKDLVKMGNEAIAKIREAYSEVICGAELESEIETTTLVNTRGLYCQYSERENSCYLQVELVRGEDFLGIYEGEESNSQINIDKIVTKIQQHLQWSEKTTEAVVGKQPILFTANAASLLWGSVVAALNSKRVLEKSSPWSDKQGEKVLSEILTLRQNPNLPGVNCPFDDEGTATQELLLIERGRLQKFYRDRTTGRKFNQESTGNGFRPSLGHYPTPELVNLSVEPGEKNLHQLIKQLDDGIVIEQVLGGGPDISGDFSINLDLGYRVKNGEIIGRVKDTMVAGNVYMTLNQVIALGNDANPYDFYHTPSIITEGLSVVS